MNQFASADMYCASVLTSVRRAFMFLPPLPITAPAFCKEETSSFDIMGWDEGSNATHQSNVVTLLWSSMRSSTISSAFLERLKACSSSMSSAGRLPNSKDHSGQCYAFIRLRCFYSHKQRRKVQYSTNYKKIQNWWWNDTTFHPQQ